MFCLPAASAWGEGGGGGGGEVGGWEGEGVCLLVVLPRLRSHNNHARHDAATHMPQQPTPHTTRLQLPPPPHQRGQLSQAPRVGVGGVQQQQAAQVLGACEALARHVQLSSACVGDGWEGWRGGN